jgi:hypothetical protein
MSDLVIIRRRRRSSPHFTARAPENMLNHAARQSTAATVRQREGTEHDPTDPQRLWASCALGTGRQGRRNLGAFLVQAVACFAEVPSVVDREDRIHQWRRSTPIPSRDVVVDHVVVRVGIDVKHVTHGRQQVGRQAEVGYRNAERVVASDGSTGCTHIGPMNPH